MDEDATQVEEVEAAPAKGRGPTAERVGSAGSSGASVVWECSAGDFVSRDVTGDPPDGKLVGEAAVIAHIEADHGGKAPAKPRKS